MVALGMVQRKIIISINLSLLIINSVLVIRKQLYLLTIANLEVYCGGYFYFHLRLYLISGIDLDDSDAVWANLTDEERNQFRDLVAAGDLSSIVPIYTPWWVPKQQDDLPKIVELDEVQNQVPIL